VGNAEAGIMLDRLTGRVRRLLEAPGLEMTEEHPMACWPISKAYQSQNSISNHDPLDLIKAEFVAPAIIELRVAR
jgi:hypothetical protein